MLLLRGFVGEFSQCPFCSAILLSFIAPMQTHPRQTLAGLSGIGDLMLTCLGGLSRNAAVGIRLGKGEKMTEILDSMNEVSASVWRFDGL